MCGGWGDRHDVLPFQPPPFLPIALWNSVSDLRFSTTVWTAAGSGEGPSTEDGVLTAGEEAVSLAKPPL